MASPEPVLESNIVSTLDEKLSKARFGVAYVRAICSHAGIGFTETSIDEDVLAIDGNIEFAVAHARVQVKCTGQFRMNGGPTASWQADAAWWKKWRSSGVPCYFVLVIVDPDDQPRWIDHRKDGTLQRAAAFWVRVDRMKESASVTVPKNQRLTAETLRQWADDVASCFMGNPEDGTPDDV